MSSKIGLSETLECTIKNRLISDRVELQKKWMPDVTIHELEQTNGTKIISPKFLKMDGKLSRDKTRNIIKLRYRTKMKRPYTLEVNYVYRPSKKILKVYSTANTDLLNLSGQVASGTCKEVKKVKVIKQKVVQKQTAVKKKVLKPVIPVRPAYKTGTALNSLNIYFKNGQSMDFMCQLEAVIQNVTTQKKTIVPFFPNIDGTGQEILKTDLENEFSSNLPLLKHLNIRIQNLSASSCSPKNVSDIQLFKNSFNKFINIDQSGNIKIPNFEVRILP